MTWFKVDDSFSDHPKLESLLAGKHSDAAISLWTLAGSWCAKHLTDGLIPRSKTARLGVRKHEEASLELIRVGLWIEVEGGYQFHDWQDYQPTRESVTADRARAAERKRRSRHADVTGDVTRDGRRDESVSHTGPTRPDPTRPKSKRVDGAAPPPAVPADERIAKLSARYPSGLLDLVYGACKRSRTTGKMSDSKWLAALEAFDAFDVAIAVRSMETFADRYSDGRFDEKYLVGIMRKDRDQPAQRGLAFVRSPAPTEDAPDWHPTHGAPKSARNFDTWEAWINDGCPRDASWRVAS